MATDSDKIEERDKQAIAIFEDACQCLWDTSYTHKDLEPALMRIQHALQILSWAEQLQSVSKEINGYDEESCPAYRVALLEVSYERVGDHFVPYDLKHGENLIKITDPISNLIPLLNTGGVKKTIILHGGVKVKQVSEVTPDVIRRILDEIKHLYFTFCSNSITQLKFGSSMDSIFEKYRKTIEGNLSQLGIVNHIQSIEQNLNQQNPESWRVAALGCRNILSDLANKLWQAPDATYEYLNNMQLKGGNTDLVKNRLHAWLHQKGIQRSDDPFIGNQLERLSDFVDDLYKMESKGKRPITYQDSLSCAINTYIFLGEIAIRTDLQPVNKIMPIS